MKRSAKTKKSGMRAAARGGKSGGAAPAATTTPALAAPAAAKAVSPHAGKRFLTGPLGVDLADANDAVEALLKANGHRPAKAPVSVAPFTTDPQRRKLMASFVTKAAHREIVMPDKRFVSSFGASSPKKMDEETKAYLREKANARKFLRPKVAKPTLAADLAAAAKAAPKKAAAAKGPGIGAWVCAQLVAGVKDDKILKEVVAKFPGAKTNAAHLAWYRGKLRREGRLK